MASCVGNIHTKNYQNLVTGFQVIVENVGDVSFETQCSICCYTSFTRCVHYLLPILHSHTENLPSTMWRQLIRSNCYKIHKTNLHIS